MDETQQDKPKLTIIRWIFAVIGALLATFAGGCSLLILGDLASRGRWSDNYVSVEIVLLIGGVPFLLGVFIWWLAVKAGRG